MKRLLMIVGFAALLLPTTWTSADAQGGQVEIRNFTAFMHPLRKIVRVIWWASEDSLLMNQIVEHSLDGVEFMPVGEVLPLLTGEEGHIYEFWHVGAPLGLNYYQLRLIFGDGTERVIDPVKVEVGVPPIYSYPTFPSNPRPGVTPLTGEEDDTNWSEAMISDIYGRPVMTVGGQSELNMANLPMGIYILNAKYGTGWQTSTFVISKN